MGALKLRTRELSFGASGSSGLVRVDKVRATRRAIAAGTLELQGPVLDVVAARLTVLMHKRCACGAELIPDPDNSRYLICETRVCSERFDSQTGALIV